MTELRRNLPILITSFLGVMAALLLYPKEQSLVRLHLEGFPDSNLLTHQARPWIVVFLCFLPSLGAIAYRLGNTFDRYLSRQFLAIFFICLSAFFGIWLLIDLNDNFNDFDGSKSRIVSILTFYLFRSPATLLLILPYALLLALIYCLGKLSRSNEIIAMIQSGTSLRRLAMPLFISGLWCSFFLMCLNYHWAPQAEGKRNEIIARAKGLPIYEAKHVLYRDQASQRLWMVGAFPENFQKGEALKNVEVTTLNEDESLKHRLNASQASWDRTTRKWRFTDPVFVRFQTGESPIYEFPDLDFLEEDWLETPSQIIKSALRIDYMGIPELSSWLASPLSSQVIFNRPRYLTQWHYRWALPMSCLVTVLLAIPLSVHFSRRANGSGIFLSIALTVLMLFVTNISLTLGEANLIYPFLAAWLPNFSFALMGIWLYQRRIKGRPIYQTLKKQLNLGN